MLQVVVGDDTGESDDLLGVRQQDCGRRGDFKQRNALQNDVASSFLHEIIVVLLQ